MTQPTVIELACPRCAGKLTTSYDSNRLTCGSCGAELLILGNSRASGREEDEKRYRDTVRAIAKSGHQTVKMDIPEGYDAWSMARGLRRAIIREDIRGLVVLRSGPDVYVQRFSTVT